VIVASTLARRSLLKIGGGALAGLLLPRIAYAGSASLVEIGMRSDPDGGKVWFDPIGVLVQPGTTIRWMIHENVHTTTAYHPSNDGHSLRIPEGAAPWNSDYLVEPGEHFEVTLSAPGVYDYYCIPHEVAGMVGRIIVREPLGSGTLPFDYFKDVPAYAAWRPVPPAAQAAFPGIAEIMRNGTAAFTAEST
jgi:plastocyanin